MTEANDYKTGVLTVLGGLFDDTLELVEKSFKVANEAKVKSGQADALYRELTSQVSTALDKIKRAAAMTAEALKAELAKQTATAKGKSEVHDGS